MSSGNSQHTDKARQDLGFDPDSPDVADPQVDPVGPAKAPESGENIEQDKRVNDKQYPPYDSKQ
jgi:hypothetical protein